MLHCHLIAICVAISTLSVHAHLFINTPIPISKSAIKDPLDASGSNFPCHGVGLAVALIRTSRVAGNDEPLTFKLGNGANTAVHGGGLCQISVAHETDLLKVKMPENWKVIKSFIGECPTSALGNLQFAESCNGTQGVDCVNDLSFKIPPEIRDGNATLNILRTKMIVSQVHT